MVMKSCSTSGTKIHLKVLPSSCHSQYRMPFSLMKIFCISTFLCNFLAISLQYASFFCNSCNCPGFSGSLISLTSSCSVTLTEKSICEFRETSSGLLASRKIDFFNSCLLNFSSNVPTPFQFHDVCEYLLNSLCSVCVSVCSLKLCVISLLHFLFLSKILQFLQAVYCLARLYLWFNNFCSYSF